MEIRILSETDNYWDKTIDLAENCSWSAGPNLGRRMRKMNLKTLNARLWQLRMIR